MAVDKKRVLLMAATGFTVPQIASRLSISERHVRRLVKGARIQPNHLIDSDEEHVLWRFYLRNGDSMRALAYRFGYSRQHMIRLLQASLATKREIYHVQ